MGRFLPLTWVFLVSACEPQPLCEVNDDLVVADGWTFVEPANDPIWSLPADTTACGPDEIQVQSFGVDEAVEIDTRFGCGWATVSQPIAADLAAGDELQARVFYFSQVTFPTAEAEIAIAIDGDVVAQSTIEIPTSSGLFAPRVTLDRAVAAGALAHFHIGNHGDNSWNLIELSRIRSEVCPAVE